MITVGIGLIVQGWAFWASIRSIDICILIDDSGLVIGRIIYCN